MSEYTPSEAQLRAFWASDGTHQPAAKSYDYDVSGAEFDRAIAKIKADAIRDAVEDIDLSMFFHSMQDRELAEQAAGAWLYDHAEVIQERGNEQ